MTVIPDIPDIMTRRGWTQGAALMRRWLRYPGNNRPERGEPDLSTVAVDWTLGYSRADKVFQQALREKIWTQEDGRRRIRDMIERRISNPRKHSSLLFV